MNFLNKMERKFGRYAIPELTKYIILCYVIGYALEVFQNMTGVGIMGYLALSPYHILHGQIWRLVSWVLIPPSGLDIFTIIMLLFYYSLGTALERTWGEFRYNVYIFSGILFTVIGAFLLYFIGGLQISLYGASIISTYYINLSIFLAFAANYPDMQVLLYFVIPIKIKWMAYLDIAYLAYNFIRVSGYGAWAVRMMILVSLLNFIIFFFMTRNYKTISPREIHRKQQFKKAVHPKMTPNITKHKCVAEQKMMGTIWNFVSVPNAMETMNIVRNIYLHIHISNNQEDMILCAGQRLYVRWDQIPIKKR